MILKTLRLKHQNCFGRLVRYVLTDNRNQLREQGFVLTHNILGQDEQGITQDFVYNDHLRTNKRKNSVLLYHEILSFSSDDYEHITDEKLRDIAEKYIEIRCPKALVLAVPHFEKDHAHIHFVISGTEYANPKKLLRMDNRKFEQVKRSIEQYQIEKHSDLSHSIVYTNKPKREKLNQKERDKSVRKERAYQVKQKKKARGQKMDKERLSLALKQMLELSSNASDFMQYIQNQEQLEVYTRNGQLAGVKYYNRKYRFRTLGIADEKLLKLQNRELEKVKDKDKFKKEVPTKKTARQIQFEVAQKQFIASTQKRFEQLEAMKNPNVENRKLAALVGDIMGGSRTMKHFLFLLKETGIEPSVKDGKFMGVYFKKELHSLGQLRLLDKARKKQEIYKKNREKKQEFLAQKQGKDFQQDLEVDIFTSLFWI